MVLLVGCDPDRPKRECRCSNSLDSFRGITRPCVMPFILSGASDFDGKLDGVGGMALDHDGSILMTEPNLNRVIRVNLVEELPSGAAAVTESGVRDIMAILQSARVSVVAGSRRQGHIDGDPDRAEFNYPTALLYDADANVVYIVDSGNSAIRVLVGNSVKTVDVIDVMNSGAPASLVRPTSLALGQQRGELYIAEPHRDAVRLLTAPRATGAITAIGSPPTSSLMRWAFFSALVVAVGGILAMSRRNRRRLMRNLSRDSPVAPPRAPKYWIQNSTF